MEHKSSIEETFVRDFRKKIGSMVRESREKMAFSQDDLAIIIDINSSTISKIENGKFAFTIDYLAKFSFYLDFEVKFQK